VQGVQTLQLYLLLNLYKLNNKTRNGNNKSKLFLLRVFYVKKEKK